MIEIQRADAGSIRQVRRPGWGGDIILANEGRGLPYQ